MSATSKWSIGIILVVIVVGVVLWKSGLLESAPTPSSTADVTTPASQDANTGLPTSQDDTSDTAMTQDAAALDAQISTLSQDSAAVDQSFSDTPISQSY